jgi:hypothetical protein
MRRSSRWLVALASTLFMAASAGAAGLVKTDTVVGKRVAAGRSLFRWEAAG